MVAQFVKKTQKTWDQRLPELRFAYNTTTSESIGYTPAYLNILARTKLTQSFQKQQRHYDLRRRDWAEAIDQEVFCKTHFFSKRADNINAKMCEKCEGPYTVIRKSSHVIFDLKDGRDKITRHIHVNDLKTSRATAEV